MRFQVRLLDTADNDINVIKEFLARKASSDIVDKRRGAIEIHRILDSRRNPKKELSPSMEPPSGEKP